jgi:signal transduction histidine kinase
MKPEVRRLGEHLLHTNERSERMIEGLLVLARSDRGLTSRTPLRLDEVVGSVLRSSAELAAEHKVSLESELLPRTVAGDPVLLNGSPRTWCRTPSSTTNQAAQSTCGSARIRR